MTGKVVVITGATSGIGRAAALQLASMGAQIVMVARNQNKASATLEAIKAAGHSGVAHAVHLADLSLVRETARVAAEIAAREPQVDVLVNNAGAIFSSRQVTSEGLERTFALNHLSYFVMTKGLLERLAKTARVVNTASDAHEIDSLDFADLQAAQAYAESGFRSALRRGGKGFRVYGRSKLANVLFTRELARRVAGTGVTANCLNPGFVATGMADEAGGRLQVSMKILKKFAQPAEKGAQTLVYLASSPEVSGVSGKYFVDLKVAPPSAAALDENAGTRLWAESERIVRAVLQDDC